jgi:hypothetical protein
MLTPLRQGQVKSGKYRGSFSLRLRFDGLQCFTDVDTMRGDRLS